MCKEKGESTFDVLSGLFTEMNSPGVTSGGRFQGTPYFNGGLFSEIPRIELSGSQLDLLIASAREDWKSVRPSIFGNIFEASSDPAKRHAMGQHFTSEADIMQVIRPTVVEPWEQRIDAAWQAEDVDALEQVRFSMQQYRVLDPACGSGNFLYMAYNSLKDLEADLLRRIQELRAAQKSRRKRDSVGQKAFGFVSTAQFFGMDTDPFAVELARVTLMIARKMAHDRLGLTEQELPLDNLDANIVAADALFTPWPAADAIVGNPPFLGGKHLRLNLGDAYCDRVFARFADVRDSVDFCSYWFRLAHDALGPEGRAGLVATNSIRHGKSRRATLEYIQQHGGHIHQAISSQPWSGEANVHVSIVNWSRERPQSCRLDGEEVAQINTSLRATADVSEAVRLQANRNLCFQGVIPVGKGFNVEPETAQAWITQDPRNAEVVKPFSMGANLARNPLGTPDRWIIDFADMTLEEAETYALPFQQVKDLVRPERLKNRRETTRINWWRYGEKRPAMRAALQSLRIYFAVPRVSKWAIFLVMPSPCLPGDLNVVIASSDYYILGILSSLAHRIWMLNQGSTLKAYTRYSHDTVFGTFPFPQHPTTQQTEAIRQRMTELNAFRNAWMQERQAGITEMYNRYFDEPASQLRRHHGALDALVLQAYGWSDQTDLLTSLLELNRELAERQARAEKVVGPWDPHRT
ncbi:MAG: DNA methyltransferase [Synechococcaceae cyanobacterium]